MGIKSAFRFLNITYIAVKYQAISRARTDGISVPGEATYSHFVDFDFVNLFLKCDVYKFRKY